MSHVAVKQAELQRVSAFVEVYEHNQICVDVSTRVYTTTTALIHIYIYIYVYIIHTSVCKALLAHAF